MTVKIGEDTYYNVALIMDNQTRKMAVTLRFNNGYEKDINVGYDDMIVFVLQEGGKQ